jgi:hypothetical protein
VACEDLYNSRATSAFSLCFDPRRQPNPTRFGWTFGEITVEICGFLKVFYVSLAIYFWGNNLFQT